MNKYVFTLIDMDDHTEFMTIMSSYTNLSERAYYIMYVQGLVKSLKKELDLELTYMVERV